MREVWREEGVRGFFRGFTPTLAREVPGYGIFFATYEMMRLAIAPPGVLPACRLSARFYSSLSLSLRWSLSRVPLPSATVGRSSR